MMKKKIFGWMLAAVLSAGLLGNALCIQAEELPEEKVETEDIVDVEEEAEELEDWIGDIPIGEFVIEEDISAGDMEINFSENKDLAIVENIPDGAFDVSLTGDEISLYIEDGIETVATEDNAGRESIQHYGTVSDYLSQTGDYKLYSLELPAGDYLQARLAVPNSTSINYALVLYDSELNVIKMSHYIPYLNGGKTLEESIGYLSASDELVYIGIFSLVGGSATEAYTLDFSITTNYAELSDPGEPDENAQEAVALNLGSTGAKVSGIINSAIDNDWYSFTVLDSPKYDKVRLNLASSASTNGCEFEIYRNVTQDYFAMEFGGGGKGEGEVDLPAGTYYIRVVSTNTFNDFNIGEMPVYNLSVVPVSRVDGIMITKYTGLSGSEGGFGYQLHDADDNWINIVGRVYYTDSVGNKTGSANVKLKITVVNTTWELHDRPDIARTYGIPITRENGFFYSTINVNRGIGLYNYERELYDVMDVEICPLYNPEKKINSSFRLLIKDT